MTHAIVETARLVLSTWSEHDAADLSVMAKDAETMRYINGGAPFTDHEVEAAIARQIDTQQRLGWCRWALRLRDPRPGEPTGVIGFAGPGCTFAPDIEMGWWVRKDLWGKGLATEAGRAAVDHCFSALGMPRLICCVHVDNAASRTVAARAGFTPLDEIEFKGFPIVRHEQLNPCPGADRPRRVSHDCGCFDPAEITVIRTLR